MINSVTSSLPKTRSQQFIYQIMQANIDLEHQMQKRIAELEQALKFESMLRRISEKVRASLDEDCILQAAVNELSLELEANCFATLLSDMEQQTFIYHTTTLHPIFDFKAEIIHLIKQNEINHQLLEANSVHFCSTTSSSDPKYTTFACPIVDSNNTVGTLWIIRKISKPLEESEIYLVEKVAKQCAIAINQARLYHAAQKHIEKLHWLNEAKNDFLSRVTHDLRAPLFNMQLSIHLLETKLTDARSQCGQLSQENYSCSETVTYLKLLRSECDREISLVNDLLDLQKLEVDNQPLDVSTIDLEDWLKELVEPLEKHIQQRELTLELHFAPNLPMLVSDPTYLHRVVSELLHNAYKYTPPHEKISVTVLADLEQVQICISNSGVEIPSEELPRIFNKFYRVPNSDRWKQGGTGLGLALVKELLKHLGGSIQVESAQMQTCFTINLPLNSAV